MSVATNQTVCALSVGDLAREVHGRLSLGSMPPIAASDSPLGRIVADSRQVESGDVFWALSGPNNHGADFAHEAFLRGASGVVVGGRHVEPWAGRWTLEVEDAHWSLWRLAALVRHRFRGKVIAVTGSVGKTTTRQMIHTVLSSRSRGTASPKNYNNHIGLPLSMLAWRGDDDYAVVELGASRPGEIDSLAGLCQPHIGVVTAVGEAHLSGFGSQAGVAAAKAELIAAIPPSGRNVLNGDDPWLRRKASLSRADITWVGRGGECDLAAESVAFDQGELRFRLREQQFCVPVWGRHYLTSVLAAIGVGEAMGIPLCEIAKALDNFQGLPQRCQVRNVRGVTIVDDTYNASPKAMRAALELLRDLDSPGRRIVACGDMVELGDEAEDWHRRLGNQIVTICGADLLVACGSYARTVATAAREAGMPVGRVVVCSSPHDMTPVVRANLGVGDALLVKGSRTMQMEKLVDELEASLAVQAA
jgi:UDP-N-acetylmuramoyl-tripeptide--D-alanyl-D-alanine ligase